MKYTVPPKIEKHLKKYKYFNKTFRDAGFIHLMLGVMSLYGYFFFPVHLTITLFLAGWGLGVGLWIVGLYYKMDFEINVEI